MLLSVLSTRNRHQELLRFKVARRKPATTLWVEAVNNDNEINPNVTIIFQFDDGRLAKDFDYVSASNVGNDNSFLGRSIGSLLMAVPPNLTPREVEAIKSKKIVRGMSRRAVFYSWGTTTENDYGRGGKQLVYGDKQFVYLDPDGKVTDWQSTR